jgi:hypothetical protein
MLITNLSLLFYSNKLFTAKNPKYCGNIKIIKKTTFSFLSLDLLSSPIWFSEQSCARRRFILPRRLRFVLPIPVDNFSQPCPPLPSRVSKFFCFTILTARGTRRKKRFLVDPRNCQDLPRSSGSTGNRQDPPGSIRICQELLGSFRFLYNQLRFFNNH